MGGLTVRVFAHEYPEEVGGVVLIESMSPSAAEPSDSTATELESYSFADWALTLPARTGILRLLSAPLGMYDGFSPDHSNAYSSFSITPRSLQTWLDEGKGMPQSLVQAGAVRSLGVTPLIVLSPGLTQQLEKDWQRMQTELLELSSNSHQLFATQSGHSIEFDEPEAAVGAIGTMVKLTRQGNS
jgi:pimeloyl-ACP methyl ester carboxylesterase